MLTDTQIKKYIKSARIRITPFDEKLVKTSSYQIRLGNTLLIPENGQLIDLKNPDEQPRYKKVELTEEGYILKPKEFILGQTLEKIAMDSDILIFADGRSTLARLGISIHQSSMSLLPGQDDHIITLEIFNASPFKIKIYPGLQIGKLIFFQSSEKNEISYKEYGKYAGQSETTGAKIE